MGRLSVSLANHRMNNHNQKFCGNSIEIAHTHLETYFRLSVNLSTNLPRSSTWIFPSCKRLCSPVCGTSMCSSIFLRNPSLLLFHIFRRKQIFSPRQPIISPFYSQTFATITLAAPPSTPTRASQRQRA